MQSPELTCASCDATLDGEEHECPECGNNPRQEVLLGLIGSGVFGAVLYLVLPVVGLMFLPLILLIGVGLLVLDFSPSQSTSVM